MGFWNVKARDLKFGDEIRMGGVTAEVFPSVLDVDTGGASGRTAVFLEWPEGEKYWETFDPGENLTVRR